MNFVSFENVLGRHGPLLHDPDLYGPSIAVFTMPQVFLLCLEASEQGCDRSDLLGNAVVVSLCLWLGLSSLYRLLSFMIAPTIELKHTLCMTGYSFLSWSLAMLLSYPLELYEENWGIPVATPLVLLGMPSAVALAASFWEHTPSSSLTLRPSALHHSLQSCATQNSRTLQRLLWAVPKIIAFVIVALTHYQFLWYVARIFLPGRKSACRLAAVLQPSKYADILTQKELRQFASALLRTKKRRNRGTVASGSKLLSSVSAIDTDSHIERLVQAAGTGALSERGESDMSLDVAASLIIDRLGGQEVVKEGIRRLWDGALSSMGSNLNS